jgi:hypothetical protein
VSRARITIAVTLFAASALACSMPEGQCVARGARTTYTGTASYTGQVPSGTAPPTALAGSMPASFVVDDFTADCSYGSMQFTVEVSGCRLTATLGNATYGRSRGGRGQFIDANAALDDGQYCDLVVPEGVARIAIDTGLLAVGGSSATQMVIAGNVVAWQGVSATAGRLEWVFDGR